MERLGKRIGHIKIQCLLAKGGMGAVYRGFDEALQREVAVKAIRTDCVGPDARGRILREARILSRLNHPRILTIHDYVEGEETDYLVLELVEGRDLREALAQGLTPAARLRIAEQVVEALVAAHAQSIVHRDLKPANVMVTPDGSVKVLDFGLALTAGWARGWKEEGEESGDPLPFRTRVGRVTGTLGFMSPEQARGEAVTLASDMYSLGLLLQELLTGQSAHPLNLDDDALFQRVREGRSLPAVGLAPDLTELIESLKSPDPAQRPTATEVLHRLRRIAGKPRRRLRALAAALGLILLGTGAVKYAFDLSSQRDAAVAARSEADQARSEAEAVSKFLVGLFEEADPGHSRGAALTAREVLDRGAEKVRTELRDQPLRRARLQQTIGRTYLRLGAYDRARSLLEDSLALRRRELGERHPDVAESLRDLAAVDQAQGRLASAERRFRQALALQEAVLRPTDPSLAKTLNDLGALYGYQEDVKRAEPLFLRALAIRQSSLGPNHPDVAATLNNLAFVRILQGRGKEARPLLRRGLAIREAALPPDHPDLAANLEALARLDDELGRLDEAEPLHRRALALWEKSFGPDHPRLGLVLANLAWNCGRRGQVAEAEALYRRSIALREKALGRSHPEVALALEGLAELYSDHERYAEAEPLYRRALAIQRQARQPDDPVLARTERAYERLLAALRRPQLASTGRSRGRGA